MQDNRVTKYRSEKEAIEHVRYLEVEYDLFQYQVDGWSAWRLLRFSAVRALVQVPIDTPPATVQRRWLRKSERLMLAARGLPRLLFPRRARHVVKTFSSARSEQVAGRYKDVYFDDLLTEIGSYFKIETLNNTIFNARGKNALIKSDVTDDVELLAGGLARVSIPSYIQDIAHRMSACLRAEPALDKFSPRIISTTLTAFYWAKRFYGGLFKRIGAEFVLLADTGEFAALAGAKELGIKAFEFQHGVFTRDHADALSSAELPYKNSLLVPDELLLYGEYWKRHLESSGFYDRELVVVGSIRVDRYRKARAAYQAKRRDRIFTLVLTTQGRDTQRLTTFAADFLKLAKDLEMCLYIKLHPIYDTEKSLYEAALGTDPRVHVLLATEAPSTFELLSQADLHVSIASACHYEAIGLGVPTIILPLDGYEVVLPLYEAGHAFLARTPQDLVNVVLQTRNLTVSPQVSEWYFKSGALENIKRELGLAA